MPSLNINGATPPLPLCAFVVLTKTLLLYDNDCRNRFVFLIKMQVILGVKSVHPPFEVFISGHVT